MDIYDVRDYLTAVVNNYINSKEFSEISDEGNFQVWSTTDGWQILDEDGNQLDVNISICQEVNYGR